MEDSTKVPPKVKAHIRDIARNRKNTVIEDIERVVDQLKNSGYETSKRNSGRGGHSRVFGVGSQSFNICTHNKGNKQLKPYNVDTFINAMTELGLYDED